MAAADKILRQRIVHQLQHPARQHAEVLRLSEQYLIRAEAYVQRDQPDYGKAGSDISVLRTARYSSYGGSTSLNKENAMDVIEQERVKELYMEASACTT